MKKIFGLLVILVGVVLLTGCGGSKDGFKCTAKLVENGEQADVEFDVKTDKDNKIKTVDVTFDFESEEYANQMVAMVEWINSYAENDSDKIDISQSGSKVTIKGYEKLASESESDEESLGNLVGMTKEEFEKSLKNLETAENVSCK